MSNILIKDTNFINVGLGTMTYAIPSTGIYNVQVQSTEVPASSLSIVVNKNGSPIFTAPVLSPTQQAVQFRISFLATAADVITVVLSSGAAVDNQFNTVKTNISIGTGE